MMTMSFNLMHRRSEEPDDDPEETNAGLQWFISIIYVFFRGSCNFTSSASLSTIKFS
jgi:hypothetical protein